MTDSASPPLALMLEEIASVIGMEAALKLAALRGGQQVNIPAVLRSDNWIVVAIGHDLAKALSDHFTSGHSRVAIDLPLGPQGSYFAARAARSEIVRSALDQGASCAEIARRAGITRRSAQRQVAKIRHERERASHRKDVSA